MLKHCQQETACPRRWVKNERVIIGEAVGSVELRFQQAINGSDDVGNNLWRRVVDTAIDAALRIVFGEESFVEVNNRIFKMVSRSKRRAEHLCPDVSEKHCDVVQNISNVRLQCR